MNFKDLKDKPAFWLILIFVLVLAVRLYIAFQTPMFNYDAYFTLRQVEHIKDTGFPLYKDPLSYGGKTQLFAPLNYYVLATFSLIFPPELVGKILPNIFAALLIVIVYYLSLKITKNMRISLTTAFMSGFIPIYFLDINKITVDYLAVLLVFSIVYCIFRIGERKYVDYALILMFLLVLTTPLAFILIIGLLLYLLLSKLENLSIEMKELEIILFFTFLVFWVNLLIYKNAFLTHGLLVVWQNIPVQMLSNFFGQTTFIELFLTVSIIPLIFGVYAYYAAFHMEHSKEIMLLISIGMSSFILLWFKLTDLITGLIFLSITLVILTAYSLKRFGDFITKSKIQKYKRALYTLLLILFIVTAIVPSVIFGMQRTKITPSSDDVAVLKWASANLPQDAIITSTLGEGNLVTYYAHRKNLMDNNFLLTPRIDQRLLDINEIYTTTFETKALGTLNKYNSKYVLITSNTLQTYNLKDISYVKDNKCFLPQYYIGNAYIYYTTCKVE